MSHGSTSPLDFGDLRPRQLGRRAVAQGRATGPQCRDGIGQILPHIAEHQVQHGRVVEPPLDGQPRGPLQRISTQGVGLKPMGLRPTDAQPARPHAASANARVIGDLSKSLRGTDGTCDSGDVLVEVLGHMEDLLDLPAPIGRWWRGGHFERRPPHGAGRQRLV